MGGISIEVEESGHGSTCERLGAKFKSLNYGPKRGWEPRKNFKQENHISKFIFQVHYSVTGWQGGQIGGREAGNEADTFIWL